MAGMFACQNNINMLAELPLSPPETKQHFFPRLCRKLSSEDIHELFWKKKKSWKFSQFSKSNMEQEFSVRSRLSETRFVVSCPLYFL